MSRVAFIGLGLMGAPMAAHLREAGHEVVAVNRSPAPLRRFEASGGSAAATVAEAVAAASVVFTMLPDGPDVEAVALGDDGIYAKAAPGTLHIDCSTIRPDTARGLAAQAGARGLAAIDAPVSGGQVGAEQAALSIMVGGAAEDVAAARPLLDCLGTTVVHVGDAGAGQTVKAANQLIVAGTIELVAEALVLLESQDAVDVSAALEVLSGGLAGSRVLELKAENMLAGAFRPGFRAELHHKDLGIALDVAREAGTAIPLGAQVASLMSAVVAQGHGQLDHGALMLLVRQLSGRRKEAEA